LQSLLLSKQDLAKAKKVLIMGGGTVGVELAAEILDKYPQKAITIAKTGTLLGRCPQAAGEYAAKQLKKRGVTFLSERVVAQSQVLLQLHLHSNNSRSVSFLPIHNRWECSGRKAVKRLMQMLPTRV